VARAAGVSALSDDVRLVEIQTLHLQDGRVLGYAEYGDPGGVPVVSCHGGLTSRLDIRSCDTLARALGVRVISPDRPGIGCSDRKPDRTLLDWPRDVAMLVDAVGIERFAVLGWSAGGPYAAACAFALPERVSACGLIASAIPRDWPGMLREVNLMDHILMRLSSVAPRIEWAVFRAMGAVAKLAPATFRMLSLVTLDRPSRRIVMGAPASDFSGPLAEGLRNPAGVVDDYRVLDAAWGFDPAKIKPPVYIWQGDKDSMLPTSWGERLAARIPNANLTICHGEGHFLALGRYREILNALIAPERGEA
jgi:pimeloyl-ACP methyl ester carboxylesterase